MQALAIVPNLNVFKNCGACQSMGWKLAGHTFCFQRSKETLSHCIVITVANPAHAALDVPVCQGVLVVSTRVLATLVRMVKQRGIGLAGLQCHLQRSFHQGGIHVCGHRPANDLAGKQIQNDRQIQPALCGVNIGEITDPFAVGHRCRKVLVQTIGCGNDPWLTLRGYRIPPVSLWWANAFSTHQARNAMATTRQTLSMEASPDAWTAIRLATDFVFHSDLLDQDAVLQCAWTCLFWLPGIVATPGYSQQLAHAFNTEFLSMLSNVLISHSFFREKMLIVFFRISRSSSTSAKRRCNCLISRLAASLYFRYCGFFSSIIRLLFFLVYWIWTFFVSTLSGQPQTLKPLERILHQGY